MQLLRYAAVMLGICGVCGSAAATTLTAMGLETLSLTADRIMVGTVEKSESHYLSSSNHYIVTDVTVRSQRNVLGVPEGTTLVVRHLGGAVGEFGQRVHGEATYRVGEQILLFAAKRQGVYYAVGMAQGALHIYRDSAGISRVDSQLGDSELVGPAAVAPTGQMLESVLTQVQAYLSRRQSSQDAAHQPSRRD